jgi:hypothetical protein
LTDAAQCANVGVNTHLFLPIYIDLINREVIDFFRKVIILINHISPIMKEQQKPNFIKQTLIKAHEAISPKIKLQNEVEKLKTDLETEMSFAKKLDYTPDLADKENILAIKETQLQKMEGVSTLSTLKSKASGVFSRAKNFSQNIGRKLGPLALAGLTQLAPLSAIAKDTTPANLATQPVTHQLTKETPRYHIVSEQQIIALVKANKLTIGTKYTIGNDTTIHTIQGWKNQIAPTKITIETLTHRLQESLTTSNQPKKQPNNPLVGTQSVQSTPETLGKFFPNPQVEQTNGLQLNLPEIALVPGEIVTKEFIPGHPVTWQRPQDVAAPELKNKLRPTISIGSVEALGVDNPKYSPTLAFTKKILQNYIEKGEVKSARTIIALILTPPNMASPGFVENPYQFVVSSRAVVNYFSYTFPSENLSDEELSKRVNLIPVNIDQTQFVKKIRQDTKQHLMSTAFKIGQNINTFSGDPAPQLSSQHFLNQALSADTEQKQNIVLAKLKDNLTPQQRQALRSSITSSLNVRIADLNNKIEIAKKYEDDISKLLGYKINSAIELEKERDNLLLLSSDFSFIDRILLPEEYKVARQQTDSLDQETRKTAIKEEKTKQQRVAQYQVEVQAELERSKREQEAQQREVDRVKKFNKSYIRAVNKSPDNLSNQPTIPVYTVPDSTKITFDTQLQNNIANFKPATTSEVTELESPVKQILSEIEANTQTTNPAPQSQTTQTDPLATTSQSIN